MIAALALSVAVSLAPNLFAQAPQTPQMINLSCVEALVAIGESKLAGVFSFVPDKDSPGAFADLIVHDKKALKKYINKLERDLKDAGGIATWDSQAVKFAMAIYGSPLAETIEKPGNLLARLEALSRAQTMSLQDLTARRRRSS